jgi:two-component system cell cycle response regulator
MNSQVELGNRPAGEWREWHPVPDVSSHAGHGTRPVSHHKCSSTSDNTNTGPTGDTPACALTILVVDDDIIELKLLTKSLTTAGHTVLCARNGQEALQVVLERSPKLIISDWFMPEMDGMLFCKHLRQSKAGRLVYLILLTGCEEEDRMVEAFEAGVDDFIVKPFRPKTLLARIRAGIRVIQLQEEVNRDKEELRQNAAELAVANGKLQEAALTDSLTGLPNRRYAMERLNQEWVRCLRDGRSLACIMVDIDHFKEVNDAYSHLVGDLVLCETAKVMREGMRLSDVICRLGGEEFVILCPDADAGAAQACAERLRGRVEGNIIEAQAFNRNITVSLGVAVRDDRVSAPEHLLKAADEAVYAAKLAGRNRVCIARENRGNT